MQDTVDILQPGVVIKPSVTPEDGILLIEKLYGFHCDKIRELNGYDDKNYHVHVKRDVENTEKCDYNIDGYVLKIINILDSKKVDFFDAQNQLLLYLGDVNNPGAMIQNNIPGAQKVYGNGPVFPEQLSFEKYPKTGEKGINCPKPVKNVNGSYFSSETFTSGVHIVRLLEFIPGSILCQVSLTKDLAYQCGKYVAELDNALKDFHHPAYENYKTLWMLDEVPNLNKFLFAIKDENQKTVIEKIIKNFEERVLVNRDKFEKGMIHGDFNEQNIIVSKDMQGEGVFRIKAILDFGDSHFSCYLYEISIAMAYIMLHGKNLDFGGYILAGYRSVRKIPEAEYQLLKICIEARICQSLVLGAYTHLEDPGNNYVLATAKAGWSLLQELTAVDEQDLLDTWNQAIYKSNS